MAEPSAFSVRPRAAIEFLRQKLRVPSEAWTDIWQEANARAFAVAGANKASLVADFHEAVTRALENGSTLEMFRQDFDAIVARHGWRYRGERGWRSEVIFRTNMMTAYSAGKWESIQRVKDRRPYIGYFAVMDGRTRDQHRHWHHLVLPVDHPFWLTHFPPNGWNCRCQARSLSERDLKRLKLTVSDDPLIVMENRTIKTPDGDLRIDVPRGVDPGFAYNPGIAGFGRGAELAALEKHARFTAITSPAAPDPRSLPRLMPVDPAIRLNPTTDQEAVLRAQLSDVLGGAPARDFTDPTGQQVRISQALVDHILAKVDSSGMPVWVQEQRNRYFPLIPDLIEDPEEIWIGFARNDATGRVLMRRRYIKLFQLDNRRVLTMVGDEDNGIWAGLTFYQGRVSNFNTLRTGVRVWRSSWAEGSG